ncbi:MAG TPA: fibrinogen-like YCDxxxxGGGW domain-containing protein, partial [Acidimicrobiia bacterium]
MMRRPLAAVLLTAVVPLIGLTGIVASAAPARGAGPTVHAGLSSADAAPSCWAIKQSFPSSASGIYWLQTVALVAPQQFYCDMTTDGGGWVLIGRGRTGWTFHETGQGTPAAVSTTVTGT